MQLATPDKRTAIVGSTGSGKTQAGVWQLSTKDFDVRPWIIFDFKGDTLIRDIKPVEFAIGKHAPEKAGLYVVRPIPQKDDDAVTNLLWNIWENERTGIYIDEGYMIGNRNAALNACLTQGRSKLIEMIVLSQRPAWMSRFVFSEADYFQAFRLNDKRDYDTVQAMISVDIRRRLPPYHSHYYDVSADKSVILSPVPGRASIIGTFRDRLAQRMRVL